MITILLVDDHTIVRDGIKGILAFDPAFEIVGDVSNAAEVLRALETGLRPDIILSDLILPGSSGMDLLKTVVASYPEIKVIMLSHHSEESTAREALAAGAAGYLAKTIRREELYFAIKHVQAGNKYVFSGIIMTVLQKFSVLEAFNQDYIREMGIKPTELEILKLIADGFTGIEIAAQLGISAANIEHFRQSLFRKTGTKNIASLIKYAVKNGLVR